MQTWTVPLLASIAILSVSARDPQSTSPKPIHQLYNTPAPESLQFAHMSPTTILIYWETPDTGGAVKYRITLFPSEGPTRTVVLEAKPYLKIDGLTPGISYRIGVLGVKSNGSEYMSRSLDLQTSSKEFATPRIIDSSVGGRERPYGVTYGTTWVFERDDETRGGRLVCEVLYCTSTCKVEEESTCTRHLSFLEYDTEHTIAVFAVYYGRRVASDLSTFTTMIGKPRPVENLDVSQEPDTFDIDITWSPPQRANGKLQYYNLQIFRRGYKVFDTDLNHTEYTFSIERRWQVADSYLIRVRAVNERGRSRRYGDFVERFFDSKRPVPSSVQNLSVTATATDGYLKLSWDEPELAFGPIEGYIVRILDFVRDREDVIYTTRTYLLIRVDSQCSRYKFSVVAYCTEELSGNEIIGKEDHLFYSEDCYENSGIPVWTIVLIGILVLVALGATVALCVLVFRR